MNQRKNSKPAEFTRLQQAEYLLLRCLAAGVNNPVLATDIRRFIEDREYDHTSLEDHNDQASNISKS